jgi:hypothetical protein
VVGLAIKIVVEIWNCKRADTSTKRQRVDAVAAPKIHSLARFDVALADE